MAEFILSSSSCMICVNSVCDDGDCIQSILVLGFIMRDLSIQTGEIAGHSFCLLAMVVTFSICIVVPLLSI